MKLWRVHLALRRKIEAEATEKEPEKFSYWLEEEEKLLGTGTCRAPELIEGASTDCRLKVQFIEPPRLWDEKDLRMALHDERHRTEQVSGRTLCCDPPGPLVPNPILCGVSLVCTCSFHSR